MNVSRGISLVLMLLLVTACAPVVYESSHRTPSRNTLVTAYPQYHPIEVTLYADNTYKGGQFYPIHLTITDGQYVPIPLKDRRGRHAMIYAHYYHNDLHFDADKNCQNIYGSTRYRYDNKWDKGYRYTNVNVGKGYDLSGLNLQVRSVRTIDSQANKVVNTRDFVRNNDEKGGIHLSKPDYVEPQKKQNNKVKINNPQRSEHSTSISSLKTPKIVDKLNKYEQSKPNVRALNKTDTGNDPVNKPIKNQTESVAKYKSQSTKDSLKSKSSGISTNAENDTTERQHKKSRTKGSQSDDKIDKDREGSFVDDTEKGKVRDDFEHRAH